MDSTSESLLLRLKSTTDGQAWSRFVELYTPLLFFWARKSGLQAADAADLTQDVLTIVHREIGRFEYDRSKSFRGWLRTITLNKHREHRRKKSLPLVDATESMMGNVADPLAIESSWDVNYQQALVGRALEILRSEFSVQTWQALHEYVFNSRSAEEVANELGISVWTIYTAKSKLMVRLRETVEGLLD